MSALIHELRSACLHYPKTHVVQAVEAALRKAERDPVQRAGLAALIAHWLTEVDQSVPPPPISERTIRQILREVRARAH